MAKKQMEIAARAPDQLGLAIRRVRKSKGFTQAELAKKAGVQQRTISKVENGQMNTEVSTILAICSALGAELLVRTKAPQRKIDWMDE